jgi:nicotinate-nucleotide pyrophosphorylase
VRDVKYTGGTPHRMMLIDLRAVRDRHIPAAEVHHARTERQVKVI